MTKVSSIKEYIDRIEQIRLENKQELPMVFRGQGNSSWEIKSTLERTGIKSIFSKEYYRSIDCLKPEINSLGHHFERNFNEKKYEHCTLCNICIPGADHHCGVFDKCIGRKNLICFYLFPAFSIILLVVFLVSIFYNVVKREKK